MPSTTDDGLRFRNPMRESGDWKEAEEEDIEDMDIEARSAPQIRKLRDFTSEDIGLRSVDSDGGDHSIVTAMEVFREYDQGDSGALDKAGFAKLLRSIGLASDAEAADKAWAQVAESAGKAELKEVDEQVFVHWFVNRVGNEPAPTSRANGIEQATQLGKKVLRPGQKAKQKLFKQREATAVPVRPESWFLIAAESHGDESRRKAEVVEQIHEHFETELLHLEDLVQSHENETHWIDTWNEQAEANFDETATRERLGWSHESMRVVQDAMMVLDMPEYLTAACYRVFLQTRASAVSGAKIKQIEKLVKTWVKNEGLQEDLLEDRVPLDGAIDAVKKALQREVEFRKTKIQQLTDKRAMIKGHVPLRVRVEGLRGDSAQANGTYLAWGLRQYWNRPVYTQHLDEHGHMSTVHNVLFYDQRHDSTEIRDGRPAQVWKDGLWTLGPTLNSDRCTAWVCEVDPKNFPLYFPPPTDETHDSRDGLDAVGWSVYDTAHGHWKLAPGNHCPMFSVQVDTADEGLGGYYQRAIEDQQTVVTHIEQKLGREAFNKNLRLVMEARATPPTGDEKTGWETTVALSDFKWWRNTFFFDELKEMQRKIEDKIIEHELCRFHMDDIDNKYELRQMLDDYVKQIGFRQEERKAAKRRFTNRVTKPTLARAFLRWKMTTRNTVSANALQDSGMFHEPRLPWNVRHPQSKFSVAWESVQATMLVYIAFSLPWRLSFNDFPHPGEFYYWFEAFIDVYFIVDVVLNFHTAFYDKSGELRGVRPGKGTADLKSMYLNYTKGWMWIDVVSVFPVQLIASNLESHASKDSGDQLKLIKMTRLLRLTKLLRLARGIRIFKKYEEQIGPTLKAAMLVVTVLLLLHVITCVWFALGGAREDGSLKLGAVSASSGWIEYRFQGSERYCGCYDDAYFDPVERLCVHRNLDETTETICESTAFEIPSLAAYYLQSAFTIFQNPMVADDYTSSLAEMLGAAAVTGVMGFLWGAVAGAWGTIFAANQMASQAYRMKINQVKEFCRLKGLDYGVKAKLVAFYEHLFPENVIVDEAEIISDLPPRMREALVKILYGGIITSIPIFYGQDTMVLTELCLALEPLPALKGDLIVREGQKGYEMYCVEKGVCRVTVHNRDPDDVSRVKTWIEETFQANGSPVTLFDSNLRAHVEQMMRRMRLLARKKSLVWKAATELEREQMVKNLTYRDIHDDTAIEEIAAEAGMKLSELLKAARKNGKVAFDATGPLVPQSTVEFTIVPNPKRWQGDTPKQMLCASLKDGVYLLDLLNTFLPPKQHLRARRPDGLSEVASLVSDTVSLADTAASGVIKATTGVTTRVGAHTVEATKAIGGQHAAKMAERAIAFGEGSAGLLGSSKTSAAHKAQDMRDARTSRPNVAAFVEALTANELPFTLDPSAVFAVNDLLHADRGTPRDQELRQTRVVKCLLSLAGEVGYMSEYLGPKLDEVNLGTLTGGDFFGELSLLPLRSQWHHRRTTTAVQNSFLYFITKRQVELLSEKHHDLKHALSEHAEDYEATLSKGLGESTSKDAFKTQGYGNKASGQSSRTGSQDPLAVIQEQLSQQGARLSSVETKLEMKEMKQQINDLAQDLGEVKALLQKLAT